MVSGHITLITMLGDVKDFCRFVVLANHNLPPTSLQGISMSKLIHLFALSIIGISIIITGCGGEAKMKEQMKATADTASFYILSSSVMCDMYENAWSKAIDDSRDFSAALIETRSSVPAFIDRIERSKPLVDSMMKLTNDAPEELKDERAKLMELYGVYTEFQSLAVTPQGSLLTFRAKTTELAGEADKLRNEMRLVDLMSPEVVDSTKQ